MICALAFFLFPAGMIGFVNAWFTDWDDNVC